MRWRRAVVLALQPVVLDHDILALDVARFAQTFAERGRIARGGIGSPAEEEPDAGFFGAATPVLGIINGGVG
jgi:hypothetical protein